MAKEFFVCLLSHFIAEARNVNGLIRLMFSKVFDA